MSANKSDAGTNLMILSLELIETELVFSFLKYIQAGGQGTVYIYQKQAKISALDIKLFQQTIKIYLKNIPCCLLYYIHNIINNYLKKNRTEHDCKI